MINDLIFGKNQFPRIVSLEIKDDKAEIFCEHSNGTIHSFHNDNIFWILTPNPVSSKSYSKLDGNLHYKYAYTFNNNKDYQTFKAILRKKNEDFYSVNDPKEALMIRDGYTYFKEMSFKDVSILSFDIETTGLHHNEDSKILLISWTYRNVKGFIIKGLVCYDNFKNQGEMLQSFCDDVQQLNPSIILGHNITSFDLPYMQYIAEQEDIELSLGRDRSSLWFNDYESKFRKDGSQSYSYKKANIYGRNVIDTMFLSIRYDAAERKFESYGLKQIIKQLGLEKPNRVFYDASKIRDNYKIPEEWEKIKEYCTDDSDDALNLFDIVGPPSFYSTQSIPKSYQAITESATGSQINSMMVRAYLQEKHSIPKGDESEHFEGAISQGLPGVYNNCFKLDVSSLYPSIMIEYEVEDKEKDPKGHFQTMVKYFTEERLKNKKLYKETKNQYYNDLQGTQKVFINSFYGFLGAPALNFNSKKSASFITEKGREILGKAIKWATGNDYAEWKKINNL